MAMTTKQVQHLLAYHGLYTGHVDGIPGPLTREAVGRFQAAFGLEADEIVGKATEEALRHSVTYGLPESDGDSVNSWWDEIEYFTREELRCKCGGRYCNGFPAEPQELLLRLADKARAHFGRPAHVVSGLRCRVWNTAQGGVANSQHMYGEAMDIQIDGVSAPELCAFFKSQPEVRYTYEINGTNVHFDIPAGSRG